MGSVVSLSDRATEKPECSNVPLDAVSKGHVDTGGKTMSVMSTDLSFQTCSLI